MMEFDKDNNPDGDIRDMAGADMETRILTQSGMSDSDKDNAQAYRTAGGSDRTAEMHDAANPKTADTTKEETVVTAAKTAAQNDTTEHFEHNETVETATQADNAKTGMTRNKKLSLPRIILIVLAVIIALLVVKRIFFSADKIEINPLSTVSVGHAAKGDVSVDTSLIGTVQPGDVYYVVPKVSGELTEIFVNVGDTVNEGDPICTIDNSKSVDAAKIQLDSAAVQISTAEEALKLARTNLDRMNALFQTGDISKQTLEQTQNACDQAQAAFDAAKLQQDAAQLQYDTQVEFSTVTAPVNGTVESTNMSINGLVSSASQVCVISSEGDNKVVFNVTDRLLAAFEPGTAITVTKQGEEYDARVTSVSTLPSAATGLYQIEAAFTKSNPIANGSSVKLTFVAEEREGVLTVDTNDISYDGGLTYVYTLSYNDEDAELAEGSTIGDGNRAGTVHKTEVETGLADNDRTEILSGIDADTLLITSWSSQLYEGAQVQVLPEE